MMIHRTRETITRSTVKVSPDEVYIVHQIVNEKLSAFGEVVQRTVETRITPPHERETWAGIRILTIDEDEILAVIDAREERIKGH